MPVAELNIPEDRLERFLERMEEISRRVERRGGLPVRIERGDPVPREYTVWRRTFIDGRWETTETRRMLPSIPVRLEADFPPVEGWTMVGHANLKNNLGADRMATTAYPGFRREDVQEAVARCADDRGAVTCHHCGTARNRKLAFVLEEQSTGLRRVYGSDCVQQYIGIDVEVVARGYERLLSAVGDVREAERECHRLLEWDWGSLQRARREEQEARAAARVDLRDLALACIAVIDADGGYLGPVAAAREGLAPVHDRALALVWADAVERTPGDNDLVDGFLEWIPRMGYRTDDLWKLKSVAAKSRGEPVDPEVAPLVARGLAVFAAAEGRPLAGSFPDCERGQRLDLDLRVVSATYDDDDVTYGHRTFEQRTVVATLVDGAGNRYAWTRRIKLDETNRWDDPEPVGQVGQWWRTRGTVKALSADRRGRALTILERVKMERKLDLVDEPAPPPAAPRPAR